MTVEHSEIGIAVLSVADKDSVVPLAAALLAAGCTTLASRGTRAHLARCGLDVDPLVNRGEDRHPELGGHLDVFDPGLVSRILGPSIDGTGGDRSRTPLSLVACDLTTSAQARLEDADVGGAFLLRAAARSWQSTIVLAGAESYRFAAEAIRSGRPSTPQLRHQLALAALGHVAEVERHIRERAVFVGAPDAPADELNSWRERP